MACTIAENFPLRKLRKELGLEFVCHSFRENCKHNLKRHEGNYIFGAAGAAMGYCQALFRNEHNPEKLTIKVTNSLKEIGAPWALSHELFWDYKGDMSVSEFVMSATEPLLNEGRVPILITPLDPHKDMTSINEILAASVPVHANETVLFRIVLNSTESYKEAGQIIKSILKRCRVNNEMPKWWPLLQGGDNADGWAYLKNVLQDDWQFLNLAVNPFTISSLPDFCKSQITVAQYVIGDFEGMTDNGLIHIPDYMNIFGMKKRVYNIFNYTNLVNQFEDIPILLILGPTSEVNTDKYNQKRIAMYLQFFEKACTQLWSKGTKDLHKEILKISA